MTPEQVKNFAMDAVLAPTVQRTVVLHMPEDQEEKYTGHITFAGQNKFRLDTPQAACFFEYAEVEEVF